MDDAPSLLRLTTRLLPGSCREFLQHAAAIEWPTPAAQASRKEHLNAVAHAVRTLPPGERRRLDEQAEQILWLTDGPGQDVVLGLSQQLQGQPACAQIASAPNQYERALALFLGAPATFEEALSAREADTLRQSASCYSGFIAPAGLALQQDAVSLQAFHRAVAQAFGCALEDVAVQVFKRLRPDTVSGDEVTMYQVSVHHNCPPEIIDRVRASELITQDIVRAASSHITYEPDNGHLEVLSRSAHRRETLARIVADDLLKSPIGGERIALKQYDYQSLAAPRNFDLTGEAGEAVEAVKVVELGYSTGLKRSLRVKIGSRDFDDIYGAARSLVSQSFDFRQHRLNYAKLSIRLRKVGKERSRTLAVVLRDDNKCNVKTQRERDRALCDRLLAKWNLVRKVGQVGEMGAVAEVVDHAQPLQALAA